MLRLIEKDGISSPNNLMANKIIANNAGLPQFRFAGSVFWFGGRVFFR